MIAQKVIRNRNSEVNEEDLAHVVKNTEILLKQSFKNHAVKRMLLKHTCYQNMWATYVAKHGIKDVCNDVMLVSFFESIKSGYKANTLWVIYSTINAGFIARFRLNLNELPRLKKDLK